MCETCTVVNCNSGRGSSRQCEVCGSPRKGLPPQPRGGPARIAGGTVMSPTLSGFGGLNAGFMNRGASGTGNPRRQPQVEINNKQAFFNGVVFSRVFDPYDEEAEVNSHEQWVVDILRPLILEVCVLLEST